jgi:hypothetical protein
MLNDEVRTLKRTDGARQRAVGSYHNRTLLGDAIMAKAILLSRHRAIQPRTLSFVSKDPHDAMYPAWSMSVPDTDDGKALSRVGADCALEVLDLLWNPTRADREIHSPNILQNIATSQMRRFAAVSKGFGPEEWRYLGVTDAFWNVLAWNVFGEEFGLRRK